MARHGPDFDKGGQDQMSRRKDPSQLVAALAGQPAMHDRVNTMLFFVKNTAACCSSAAEPPNALSVESPYRLWPTAGWLKQCLQMKRFAASVMMNADVSNCLEYNSATT